MEAQGKLESGGLTGATESTAAMLMTAHVTFAGRQFSAAADARRIGGFVPSNPHDEATKNLPGQNKT